MSCQEDTQNNNMILNEYEKYIQDLCCFRTLRYLVWLQFVILNPGNLNHQRHQLEWIKEFISSNSIIEKHESTQSFLGFYEATMPRWNDSLIFTRWRTDGQTNKNLLTEKSQDITKVTVKVVYWCKKPRQCGDQYGRGEVILGAQTEQFCWWAGLQIILAGPPWTELCWCTSVWWLTSPPLGCYTCPANEVSHTVNSQQSTRTISVLPAPRDNCCPLGSGLFYVNSHK